MKYSLAAAMINQINRVDTISNNLANVNTNGFKQEGLSEGSFNNYLKKMESKNQEPDYINKIMTTVPKLDAKYTSDVQGAIVPTANNLDFALTQKNSFFKVQNEKGEVFLSRDGAFRNSNGFLVNGTGEQVLNASNDPIAVAEGFGTLVGIAKTNYENLEKVGNNNYRILDEENVENLATNEEDVVQSSLEKSNVNSVHTMVSLIDAHRRFAQSQKAIESMSEMNKSLVEKLGRA